MKLIRFIVIACFINSVFLSGAHADGNRLLKECQVAERFMDTKEMSDPFDAGMCWGLIQGVKNTLIMLENNIHPDFKICPPTRDISNGQITRIVLRYLKNNPASLHEPESKLIIQAILEAYPCK